VHQAEFGFKGDGGAEASGYKVVIIQKAKESTCLELIEIAVFNTEPSSQSRASLVLDKIRKAHSITQSATVVSEEEFIP
jgi:hypothetical protein